MSYGSYGGRYGKGGYSSGLGTPYSSLSAPTALSRSLSPSPGSYGADRPRSPMRTAGLSAYTAAGARMSPSRSPTLSRSYTGSTRTSGGLATLLSMPDPVRARSGSAGSLADSTKSETESRLSSSAASLQDDDELDYKKMYLELKEVHERLRSKVSRLEDELDSTKRQLEKSQLNNRNSLSDAEKRERRALERKISELEEELKGDQGRTEATRLREENARLREENGALIRVISKLSK